MFTECLQNERRIIFCKKKTQKLRRDLNNKINNSPIFEVSIVSFHAAAAAVAAAAAAASAIR